MWFIYKMHNQLNWEIFLAWPNKILIEKVKRQYNWNQVLLPKYTIFMDTEHKPVPFFLILHCHDDEPNGLHLSLMYFNHR